MYKRQRLEGSYWDSGIFVYFNCGSFAHRWVAGAHSQQVQRGGRVLVGNLGEIWVVGCSWGQEHREIRVWGQESRAGVVWQSSAGGFCTGSACSPPQPHLGLCSSPTPLVFCKSKELDGKLLVAPVVAQQGPRESNHSQNFFMRFFFLGSEWKAGAVLPGVLSNGAVGTGCNTISVFQALLLEEEAAANLFVSAAWIESWGKPGNSGTNCPCTQRYT